MDHDIDAERLTFSVVIPTYGRPDHLGGALDALAKLDPAADEILLVIRDDDVQTHDCLRTRRDGPAVEVVAPERPGLHAAYAAGYRRARGHIVAFSDDDARVAPDWLDRLASHYRSDPRIGAVGGRDDVVSLRASHSPNQLPVGRVLPWGRMVGNHHLGSGPARDVDFLKGVVMSIRRSAVCSAPFEQRLIGPAVPPAVEISATLAVKANGFRIVYDPSIVVTHLAAPRVDVQRNDWTTDHARAWAHNHALVFGRFLPRSQYRRWLAWSVLVGTGPAPGLVWTVRACLTGRRRGALHRLEASLRALRSGRNESRRQVTPDRR